MPRRPKTEVMPVLPDVEVVERIRWKNSRPVARFVVARNRILLSREELSQITDDSQWRHVVWHELGHWWHSYHVKGRIDHETEEQLAEDIANILAGNGSTPLVRAYGGISEVLAEHMRNFTEATIVSMHGALGS